MLSPSHKQTLTLNTHKLVLLYMRTLNDIITDTVSKTSVDMTSQLLLFSCHKVFHQNSPLVTTDPIRVSSKILFMLCNRTELV